MKRLIYSSNRIEDNLFAIESQLKGLKYNLEMQERYNPSYDQSQKRKNHTSKPPPKRS